MMKKLLLPALLILLLLLPQAAGAITVIDHHYQIFGIPGETHMPQHENMTYYIDRDLSLADFDVTYVSDHEKISFDEEGRVTLAEDLVVGLGYTAGRAIYTHKATGKQYSFVITVKACAPTISVSGEFQESYQFAVGQRTDFRVMLNSNAARYMDLVVADPEVLQATFSYVQNSYDNRWDVTLKALAVGQTSVDMIFFDRTVTIPVEVVNPPTELRIGAESFDAYVNEPIDLGIEMIGGGGHNMLSATILCDNIQYHGGAYFDETYKTFTSPRTGFHEVTVKTANGLEARTIVNVYDRDICASLKAEGIINAGTETELIHPYNAEGKKIYVPMKVTEGADIASFVDGKLVTTGTGKIVVTAYSVDGSTVSETFEVVPDPTEIILNETYVTLEIDETLNLEVGFDQGTADYTVSVYINDYFPPYHLFPVAQLDDLTYLACAPGVINVNVSAGPLRHASCTIEVLDSDKAVHLETPEMLGIGHTWQYRVLDKTGKEYPATYTWEKLTTDQAATLTEDGLITGQVVGTLRIYAKLEDGRVLRWDQEVVKVPKWIAHPDMEVHENYTTTGLNSIQTDVGVIYSHEVNVSVADESIATFNEPFFTFHQPGQTQVTLTAKNGGAQTTFTLVVYTADDTLYAASTSMQIPMDYAYPLPEVYDYYGNPVKVQWEMVHETVGFGNPHPHAFILNEDNTVDCLWADGACEIVGTAESGAKIKIYVNGFRLALKIAFQEQEYVLEEGTYTQVGVRSVGIDMDRQPGDLLWIVEDSSIIEFTERYPGVGMPAVIGLKPGSTTLTAIMINGKSATCTVTVTEAPRRAGDANEDKVTDKADALLIFQKDAGWDVVLNEENADVNADGVVDLQDGHLILRYYLGDGTVLQ